MKSFKDTSESPIPEVILASISPRRKTLLESLGIRFQCRKPNAEELSATPQNIREIVRKNSVAKAKSVTCSDTEIILAADTLVCFPDEVLSKPENAEDAIRMLRKLSGRTHTVWTGLTLVSPQYGSWSEEVTSNVTFFSLSEERLKEYVKTKEPMDKAGAYAVQGVSALFIERIEGSYTNVMGLPIENLMLGLEKFTGRSIFEWFR